MKLRRALVVLALVGCSPHRPQPPRPPPVTDDGGFSLDSQEVGAPTDGLVLRSVRHAPHPGYYRLVFDLGTREGKPAKAVPRASASYRPRDRSIEVAIAGVREDLTGNLPLRTETGQPYGKPIPIERPPISHLARLLVLDDAEIAYRIQLTREAPFRLQGLSNPARIVLDIQRDDSD